MNEELLLIRKYQEVASLTEETLSKLLEQNQLIAVRNYLGTLIMLQGELLETLVQSAEDNDTLIENDNDLNQFDQRVFVDFASVSTISDVKILPPLDSKVESNSKKHEVSDRRGDLQSDQPSKKNARTKLSGNKSLHRGHVWTIEQNEKLISWVVKSRQEKKKKYWKEIAENLNRSEKACVGHYHEITKNQS